MLGVLCSAAQRSMDALEVAGLPAMALEALSMARLLCRGTAVCQKAIPSAPQCKITHVDMAGCVLSHAWVQMPTVIIKNILDYAVVEPLLWWIVSDALVSDMVHTGISDVSYLCA